MQYFETARTILNRINYPGFPRTLDEYGFVKHIGEGEAGVEIVLEIPSASEELAAQLRLEIGKRLETAQIPLDSLEIRQPPKTSPDELRWA